MDGGGGSRNNIQIDLDPGLPRVMADRRRIVQVLGNLLSNAARHSPESSVIRVTAALERVHVAFSVADDGRGLSAGLLPTLVWKFSRFTRKREHAVAFKSMLRRKGVRVVSITEHADDTPTGKLLEAIIESVDEFYSENLAQEVTRGMREAASRGFWIGSRTPYGYSRVMVYDGPKKRPTLEPDPDASRVVKRIFDMAEAGAGMLHIARALNDEGIASPSGKLWSKNGIHFILRNEVYGSVCF